MVIPISIDNILFTASTRSSVVRYDLQSRGNVERVCSSAEVILCIGILDNDSALLQTGTQYQDILQTRTKSYRHYTSPG